MYRRKPIDYVWGDSINKENITQMFQITFEGLKDDFIQFYKSKEFTDFEINEIPVHKELIELRTGLTAEFVKQKCEYFNKPDIVQFIKWIYTDEIPQKSESFSKLLTLLEIEDFQTRSLENAISDLFFDEKGKDFEILFENGSIPVHKLILQCRTGLFHGMFLSTSGNISKVRDYTKKSIKAVKLLIEYLYLDSLDIFQLNDDIIQDLSDCVDYYQLNPRCNLKYELYYH
ncbi:hypothetical protein M0812_04634 [Anaeramoeba flamelloides]|nr:hypothetical protein M0812_04634 [Anaeramoeba flamelloides]